ncbi:Na+/H+ antiporter subunit E, partial [Streptomyces griseus]|nr:Na+/H+ antiporter subunit E [Streptomyces griseus]
ARARGGRVEERPVRALGTPDEIARVAGPPPPPQLAAGRPAP